MRHLVKRILLVLESTVIVALTLGVFVFIKIVNYIADSVHYVYLLAYFVFNVLQIRVLKNVNSSEPVFEP